MRLAALDYVVFAAYLVIIVIVGLYLARREDDAADYFLAGRALRWWIIGASLIATNISTEHFVGMAGSGYTFGLAIASYEWMAAVTLIIVGRWFLPVFLRHQIYTMPQFLEIRFNAHARAILAAFLLGAYVFVALAAVLYSGAIALSTIFGVRLWVGIALIGGVTGLYTIYGGLKAVVFTDFVQLIFLLAGGIVASVLGLRRIGGFGALLEAAPEKFHTVLPLSHPELPWFGVFFGGLWIANLFYWGCNQYITQRTLAARSLKEGQHGVLFAAYLKLLIPFIVVIPGIIAWALYRDQIQRADMAYPYLIRAIVPTGLAGLFFAGLLAAVMSSLSSMLNSSATIFTMDLYARYIAGRERGPEAPGSRAAAPQTWGPERGEGERSAGPAEEQARLIRVGRWSSVVILVLATAWAPFLARVGRIFSYMQEFWGIITPGVAVVFLLGLFWRPATARGAVAGLLATIPITVGVKIAAPGMAFLNQMFAAGALVAAVVALVSLREPSAEADRARLEAASAGATARGMPGGSGADALALEPSRIYPWLGWLLIAVVAALYAVFF